MKEGGKAKGTIDRMGIGPYHLIDITTKTFKFLLKFSLKMAFLG
jgi:hypothetical protein